MIDASGMTVRNVEGVSIALERAERRMLDALADVDPVDFPALLERLQKELAAHFAAEYRRAIEHGQHGRHYEPLRRGEG